MWGMVAEFRDHHAVSRAARQLRQAGYRRLDAFTPYPVEEMETALGLPPTRIGLAVLVGGLLGAAGGYALQWYTMVVDYPINVGGRPLHSWPAFIPVTFEMMVLTATLFGVLALFVRNGLPRPHHPVLAAVALDRASEGGFFLAVEASDPRYSAPWTRQTLERLGALSVAEVPDA
jgi:hypothetical protein